MTSDGTTRRSIRVDDETWQAAKEAAEREGTDVSTVIRDYLRKFAGIALVALVAMVGLSACGSDEPDTSPEAGHTAVVETPVAETPGEAVSEPVSEAKPLGDKFAVGHSGTIKVTQLEPRTYAVEVYTGESVEFAGTYTGTDSAGVEHIGTPLVPVLRAHGVGGQSVTFDTDVVTITYTDADLGVTFTWAVG